jgi:hypothetical protein
MIGNAIYPDVVAFITLYQGPRGLKARTTEVLHSQEEMDKAFAGLDVTLSAKVDFSSEDVTVVALGQRATTGYAVEITGIICVTDRLNNLPNETLISYHECKPSWEAAEIPTSPMHVVKSAKIKAVVSFNPV